MQRRYTGTQHFAISTKREAICYFFSDAIIIADSIEAAGSKRKSCQHEREDKSMKRKKNSSIIDKPGAYGFPDSLWRER